MKKIFMVLALVMLITASVSAADCTYARVPKNLCKIPKNLC